MLPEAIFSTDEQVYPDNWDEIATAVKESANWKCVRCGHPHDPGNGYTLTVHHLIPAKQMREIFHWSLVPICQRCHLSIQGRVVLERPWMLEHTAWFKPYVAGYYAHALLGEDLDRAEVEARMDELLAAGQPWLYGEAG